MSLPRVRDDRKFEVRFEALPTGMVEDGAESVSLRVGQRVLRDGVEEMWDSVALHCAEEDDGTLVVRVLVFNPDWDEPLQIACIRSRPRDATSLTALGCNLDHVTP